MRRRPSYAETGTRCRTEAPNMHDIFSVQEKERPKPTKYRTKNIAPALR